MSKYVCNYIQYILANNVSSISDNVVTPSGENELAEISFSSKAEFEIQQKQQNGNPYWEQSMTINKKYTNISEINDFIDSHLILVVQLAGDETFVWGSVIPYNPVVANVSTKNGYAEIKLFRQSDKPQF